MLHALHTPFIIGDSSLSLSVSIGISMFPTDGETVSALLFNADIALYRAKQSGRNRFCFFDESSTEQKIIN
jgi:diguanylate cyclase (GGDEF)-like protein